MAFDATLGHDLQGKALRRIPPNASPQDQIAALNEVISALNNFNRAIVFSDIVTWSLAGAGTQILTVAHNLGYRPRVLAYISNVSITIGADVYSNITLALPTSLSSAIVGTGGPGSPAPLAFYSWLDFFVDDTNIYFIHRSGIPELSITLPISYYLTRETSKLS